MLGSVDNMPQAQGDQLRVLWLSYFISLICAGQTLCSRLICSIIIHKGDVSLTLARHPKQGFDLVNLRIDSTGMKFWVHITNTKLGYSMDSGYGWSDKSADFGYSLYLLKAWYRSFWLWAWIVLCSPRNTCHPVILWMLQKIFNGSNSEKEFPIFIDNFAELAR